MRKMKILIAFMLTFTLLFSAFPIQAVATPSVGVEEVSAPQAEQNASVNSTSMQKASMNVLNAPKPFDGGSEEIDPTAFNPGGGGIVIGPENNPLDSGVYSIVNSSNSKAVTVDSGGTTVGTQIQQSTKSTLTDRNQLFKITFISTVNNSHYYTIRSMTNSALGLYSPSNSNGAVTLQDIGTVDHYSSLDSTHRWVITEVGIGIYYFQRVNNLGSYLCANESTTDGIQLTTVMTHEDAEAYMWTLEKYTGEAIEGYDWISCPMDLTPGDTYSYSASMYSSVINKNGPVTYSVCNQYGSDTICATMNATEGKLTTSLAGDIQVRLSIYEGVSWLGWENISISIESGIVHTIENISTNKLIKPQNTQNLSQIQNDVLSQSDISFLWEIEYVDSNYFTIRNDKSNYYLIAPDDNTEGTRIYQTTNFSSRNLWRVQGSTNGYFKIQSKNQYERNATNPLYLAIDSSGYLVQSASLSNNEWILKPLTMRMNVLYDQAFIDRFGDTYMQILQSVFSDNSNDISIADVLKTRYRISLKVKYNSTPYQSYPYTENCMYKNELDTICNDCKNANTIEIEHECWNGLHHKSETRIVSEMPSINTSDSTQINILFTGHDTCYGYVTRNSAGEVIKKYHQNAPYAHGWAMSNCIAIIAFTHYNDLVSSSENKYDNIITTVAHEMLHTIGVPHCNGDNPCIMGAGSPEVTQNITMCNTCQSIANFNKFQLYYHQ